MRKFLLAAAAIAVLASPAIAHPPQAGPHPDDPLAREMVRALPGPGEVEAIAPVMDRVMGAMLNVDVGPLIDAADPYARHPGRGVAGRTLGAIGSRDDPYFEERLRSSIYGATADMGRMMGAFAAAAPGIVHSFRQMEGAIHGAVAEHGRHWDDDHYYPDDGPYPDDRFYPDDRSYPDEYDDEPED